VNPHKTPSDALVDMIASGALRVRIDVYHHFPDSPGGRLEVGISAAANLSVVPYIEPAVRAVLTLSQKEQPMPSEITVDVTNETISLGFTDRTGEATSAPTGLDPISFTSDNNAVATVAVDPNNPLQGDITPTGAGTVNLGIQPDPPTVNGGQPLTEPDGSPFPAAGTVALTVDPGAATGERLTLS
jgi:hypothetical protein